MTVDSGKVIVSKSDAQFDFRKKLAILRQHLGDKINSSEKANVIIRTDGNQDPKPESPPQNNVATTKEHNHEPILQ